MNVILMIIYASLVLGFLVFIHEGGHYLASRLFGVRVSEFMLGFPGPGVSIKRGETRFGITCVPLGGYARVCGMEVGDMSPHLKPVMAFAYTQGAVSLEQVMEACEVTESEAQFALDELVEWGSLVEPRKKEEPGLYRTPAKKRADEGTPIPFEDIEELFQSELSHQYRSLTFWKRCVILLAGILVNLLFAMLAFVLIYSVIGYDVQMVDTGEIQHLTVSPGRAIHAGFAYIGMVAQAVANLLNPVHVADTIHDSTSILGIAVLSKSAAEEGLVTLLNFTAMISVSLGIMNLLPIPPLDGGRFVVEIIQWISGKTVSQRTLNTISLVGMGLFMVLFVVMLGQDVSRFVFGNWG